MLIVYVLMYFRLLAHPRGKAAPWGKSWTLFVPGVTRAPPRKTILHWPIKSCFLYSLSNQTYCRWRFIYISQLKLSIGPSLESEFHLSVTFEKISVADRPRQIFPDFYHQFLIISSTKTAQPCGVFSSLLWITFTLNFEITLIQNGGLPSFTLLLGHSGVVYDIRRWSQSVQCLHHWVQRK